MKNLIVLNTVHVGILRVKFLKSRRGRYSKVRSVVTLEVTDRGFFNRFLHLEDRTQEVSFAPPGQH